MKISRLILLGILVTNIFVSAGCDNSAKNKTQAEQEATKNGTRVDPGNYKAKELDTSMGTPTPSPKTEVQK